MITKIPLGDLSITFIPQYLVPALENSNINLSLITNEVMHALYIKIHFDDNEYYNMSTVAQGLYNTLSLHDLKDIFITTGEAYASLLGTNDGLVNHYDSTAYGDIAQTMTEDVLYNDKKKEPFKAMTSGTDVVVLMGDSFHTYVTKHKQELLKRLFDYMFTILDERIVYASPQFKAYMATL